MKTEAEIEMMQLEAKECQGLLTTTRSKEEAREDSFLEFSEVIMALPPP